MATNPLYVLRIYMGNPKYHELIQTFMNRKINLNTDYSWSDSSDCTNPMTYNEAQKLRDSFEPELRQYISVYRSH